MPGRFRSNPRNLIALAVFTSSFLAAPLVANDVKLSAKFNSAFGWVKPNETYPFFVHYEAGASGAAGVTISVTLHPSSVFIGATPPPSTTSPLTWSLGALAPNAKGQILVRARAKSTGEDPEIMWKDISATAHMTALVGGVSRQLSSKTFGPKVTTQQTARFGERPFPVVMVQYQDVRRCTGVGQPYEECTGDHNANALDTAVNSKTSGTSLWQLYQDMSFGQLYPIGQVRPAAETNNVAFDPTYNHKFSSPLQYDPTRNGFCSGTTIAASRGTPLYPNRVENGWYVLPGTQGYYGSDSTGHALLGSLTGQGLLFGVDDGCGPSSKIVYDAASLADPDLDYNEFDTDRDGVVDFFNLMFAGDGGNGNVSLTGINNVWPHKFDLRYEFRDANGETGYVSNDQLRNHERELMWWANNQRLQMTTTNTGIPVYVRVGPYNVNPESAVEKMSVIAHEYGHSLGLPDFYSTGARSTFGSWELMATDYAQFMSLFTRQELGWIVPVEVEEKVYTLRESKKDSGTIHWKRPDGTPYTLTGPDVHNADAVRINLPNPILIDSVTSGVHAWHSGTGHNFGCPGHTLDVYLPDLENFASATSISAHFKSWYEIEWDWDYGFVLVSSDGGQTWKSLPSRRQTTISGHNPNNVTCYATTGNGITGVSGEPNTTANSNREGNGVYNEPVWIDDEFDLTEFKGQRIILRFAYFTDEAVKKRGWFIDDLRISADGQDVYRSDFETLEHTRIFPGGWSWITAGDAVDTDHAYYIETRDRISWDKDGKFQSERGTPTWAPGVAIYYTDENYGYGNTSNTGKPAQTIVDSKPQPGVTTPNLDDAAFTALPGDDKFNGCTHIDNYVVEAGGTEQWKLPNGGIVRVDSLTGLSTDGVTSNATATVVVDLDPNCAIATLPPVLRFAAGHQDPDQDGTVDLEWSRPADSIGPDQLQEATEVNTLVTDDAESGFGQWARTTEGIGAFNWEQSELKKNSGRFSFWARTAEGALNAASVLTLAQPVTLPATGHTTLTFYDWYMHEGDDKVVIEVSENGASWTPVYEGSRSALAPDAVAAFESEVMTRQVVDLATFKGLSIHLRFRFVAGPDNRAGSTPMGWFVDDLRLESANWNDVATVIGNSYSRTGLSTGIYYYRVRTTYPGGPDGTPSPWSNVISTGVEFIPVVKQPDLIVSNVQVINNKGAKAGERVTINATVTNSGEAAAGSSVTRFTQDGTTVLGTISTPPLAPGGSVQVTVQWNTTGLKDQHTVTITADDAAAVTESNEANNIRTETYTLKGGRVQ